MFSSNALKSDLRKKGLKKVRISQRAPEDPCFQGVLGICLFVSINRCTNSERRQMIMLREQIRRHMSMTSQHHVLVLSFLKEIRVKVFNQLKKKKSPKGEKTTLFSERKHKFREKAQKVEHRRRSPPAPEQFLCITSD